MNVLNNGDMENNMEKTVGDTQVPLTATINGNSGGVTGQTVVAAIRRPSDGFWLDFNDNTFKNSGWTTRQITCGEVDASNAPGVYEYLWDSSSAVMSPVALVVEFDVSGTTDVNVSEALNFVAKVEDDVWDALRVDHTVLNSFGEEMLDSSSIDTALNNATINGNSDFNTLGGAINLLRKAATNRRVLVEGDTNNFTLYDDDDVTPIIIQDIQDKNNGVIVADAGSPMYRSKAV